MPKCKHRHNQTHTELDYDRTRTTTLRKQYSADMYKRFRAVKGLIRDTIVDYDAFNLVSNVEAKRNFPFTTDAAKADAFMDWLQQAQDDEILEITDYSGGRVVGRNKWQNTYVRRSYHKGIKFANREMKKAGIDVSEEGIRSIFNKPIHANMLAMMYQRNFKQLKGITEAMDQQISRVLTDGLAQGQNPRKVARRINGRVDNIGLTRARTLARTETIRTHAEATKNRYKEYGVDMVNWIWGRGPCPSGICPDHAAGGPYKLENAPTPVADSHPNCTCTLVPAT